VVIPGGAEHEAWFLEDTEMIDFFAPPRDDFLLGGNPRLHQQRLNTSRSPAPFTQGLMWCCLILAATIGSAWSGTAKVRLAHSI
jgi:hypothetical protein